jgi:hypothetical protein
VLQNNEVQQVHKCTIAYLILLAFSKAILLAWHGMAWHGMALGVHPNLQIVKEHI